MPSRQDITRISALANNKPNILTRSQAAPATDSGQSEAKPDSTVAKRGGRPAKAKNDNRSEKFLISVTAAQMEEIKSKAGHEPKAMFIYRQLIETGIISGE